MSKDLYVLERLPHKHDNLIVQIVVGHSFSYTDYISRVVSCVHACVGSVFLQPNTQDLIFAQGFKPHANTIIREANIAHELSKVRGTLQVASSISKQLNSPHEMLKVNLSSEFSNSRSFDSKDDLELWVYWEHSGFQTADVKQARQQTANLT